MINTFPMFEHYLANKFNFISFYISHNQNFHLCQKMKSHVWNGISTKKLRTKAHQLHIKQKKTFWYFLQSSLLKVLLLHSEMQLKVSGVTITNSYLKIDFWIRRTLQPLFFTFLQISRIYCLSSLSTRSIWV